MCCGNCSDNLSLLNLIGPQGVSITGTTSEIVGDNIEITFTLSNGGTTDPILIPLPDDGLNGQSIDHIEFTSSTGTPSNVAGQAGETDTYTIWGNVGETINLGTFQIYNPEDLTTPDSCTNMGTGAAIYKAGTDTPFEFRSAISSDGTITITQNTNDVDFKVNNNSWREVLALGSTSLTEPYFFTPGSGFTGIANASGTHTVAFRKDPLTNKIFMKGAVKLTGAGVIGFNPVGSANTSSVVICVLPVNLSTGIGVRAFATAQLYNSVIKHASTVLVDVTAGAMSIIVDHRLNYLDANTYISFENTVFSTSNA